MKRPRIVAGNWKMNLNLSEGRDLARDLAGRLQPGETTVVLCTPFIHLQEVGAVIRDIPHFKLGAQNCHQEEQGAYTGEVSAAMLRSVGADYVILGHSERREYFFETDELLAKKINRALATGLRPIFCCGEKLEVREAGQHRELVARQVETALFHLSPQQFGEVVVAYEPVWAIGTGRTASPEQAQEMHRHIRSLILQRYGEAVADATAVLYGGSVKASNARELFSRPDVDGGLIGGASMAAGEFAAIVDSF